MYPRTIGRFIVWGCALAVLTAPVAARGQAADTILQELREITHPNGVRRELKEVDYGRLAAAIPPAMALAEVPPGLWRQVLVPYGLGGRELGKANLYDILWTAVSTARLIAPTREDREKWCQVELQLTLRMLRDPRTQRIYAEKRDPNKHGSDFDYVSTLRARGLQGIRMMMVHDGFTKPEDWGFYSGFTWVNAPGVVLVHEGVVFVERSAFVEAGIPIQFAATAATARNGQRQARIPIGTPEQAGPRRGFRDANGRVYLPVEELHRQGVYEVLVVKSAQMVELFPNPPHEH